MELVILYALVGLVVMFVLGATRVARWWERVEWALFWPFFAPLAFAGSTVAAAQDSEDPLAEEHARIRMFVRVLDDAEARLRAMDTLLASASFDRSRIEAALAELAARGVPDDDVRVKSVRARQRDATRLREVRARADAEMEHARLKLQEVRARIDLLAVAGAAGGALAEATAGLDEVGVIVDALSNAWLPAQGSP